LFFSLAAFPGFLAPFDWRGLIQVICEQMPFQGGLNKMTLPPLDLPSSKVKENIHHDIQDRTFEHTQTSHITLLSSIYQAQQSPKEKENIII